ncbi:hypothetical protein ACG873_07700 [Mesorhizobium sp. AaZ16]|uniref:hypothetical protein n=1 Tax=Mesorhizobium sp. AaZ16 TaxID=3402289 RepID=UPI00374E6992
METGAGIYLLSGVWSVAMLAVFIWAIRLSYRIEARSPELQNTSGVPRNALIFHTVTNRKVARDEETQALRRWMNRLLLLNLAGFALLWLAISRIGR